MHSQLAQHLLPFQQCNSHTDRIATCICGCFLAAAEDVWRPQEEDGQAPRSWRSMAPPVTLGTAAAAGVNHPCCTLSQLCEAHLFEHVCLL